MSNITKYKPIFVLITAGLLFFSYNLMEKNKVGKSTKIIFWVSAIISIILLYYSNIMAFLTK